MLLNFQNLLERTGGGQQIYEKILQEHNPKSNYSGFLKKNRSIINPFFPGGNLRIWRGEKYYEHCDTTYPTFKGNAIDFAGRHFKCATRNELYYMINQTMNLGLQIPAEKLLEKLQQTEEEAHPKVSFFKSPISNVRPSASLSLPQVYQRLLGPGLQQVTETFRKITDPKEARKFKARHFPYVTFAGCFEKREDRHLTTPSGLLVIDLDHLQELSAIREALIAERSFETELLFVSPSGHGLKWVTGYSHLKISHQEYFQLLSHYLQAVYNLTPDQSGKDISRACFLCHDPEAFIHRRYLFGSE